MNKIVGLPVWQQRSDLRSSSQWQRSCAWRSSSRWQRSYSLQSSLQWQRSDALRSISRWQRTYFLQSSSRWQLNPAARQCRIPKQRLALHQCIGLSWSQQGQRNCVNLLWTDSSVWHRALSAVLPVIMFFLAIPVWAQPGPPVHDGLSSQAKPANQSKPSSQAKPVNQSKSAGQTKPAMQAEPSATSQPVQAERRYKAALPGYKYSFPADHFSHDQFKTEWWYYTGHLKSEDGRRFGFELTFFRNGADKEPLKKNSVWAMDNFYMAHFAVTDERGKTFRFYEKLNRKGLGLADARQDAFYVFNEGWSVEKLGEEYLLRAGARDYSIHLLLKAAKPPVVHGVNGVSQKASCVGCASHYYSMTRLSAEGNIFIGDKSLPVTGQVWMDHEFGSNQLTGDQVGWDWFSMQLADNREVMLYIMRRVDGTLEKESSGTVVYPDGRSKHLKLGDFKVSKLSTWKSAKSGGVYPSGWQVQIPSEALTVTLKPILLDQELKTERSTGVNYWEGAVDISGKSKDKPISGEGYVEMTGYCEKFNKKL